MPRTAQPRRRRYGLAKRNRRRSGVTRVTGQKRVVPLFVRVHGKKGYDPFVVTVRSPPDEHGATRTPSGRSIRGPKIAASIEAPPAPFAGPNRGQPDPLRGADRASTGRPG